MNGTLSSGAAARALGGAIALLVALSLNSSALGTTPQAKHGSHRIAAASVVSLPSTKQCVSGGQLTLQLRKVAHVRWIGATVKVNNRRVKSIARARVAKVVRITGLPTGSFVLTVRITTSDGRSVTVTRTYKTCVAPQPAVPNKPVTGTSTPPKPAPDPTPAPAPAPSPTPGPTPVATLTPGSYSGLTSSGYGVTFYVPDDQAHLLEVHLPIIALGCTPGGNTGDHLQIADIAVSADGSFTATTTQDGIFAGSAAHFTYSFSGNVSGTSLRGQYREDITYNNGTAYSCTSNDQTWTAARDAQGAQTAPPVAPGSYSGLTWSGYGVSFYVPTGGAHLLDVHLPIIPLGCTPGGSTGDHLQIADIPIAADGSFTATTTQDGVVAGSTAHFKYTFSGHYHGTTSAGVPRLAGQYREDITYNNGTAYSCTSNDQTWTATHG
jgi:hypothetical protein